MERNHNVGDTGTVDACSLLWVLLLTLTGCTALTDPIPAEQRSVHVAVDVSESLHASPERCAAAAQLVRTEVVGLRRGSVKVSLWISGTKRLPEPELLLETIYSPARTGKLRQREALNAERMAFADAFERECQARLAGVTPRDASPIYALVRRVAEQHVERCRALLLVGERVCAPAPLFMVMSDLRESGGNDAMEKRLLAARRARLRPKSKVDLPSVPSLGLPDDARVIVCGVGAEKITSTIAAEDASAAWRSPGLLGSAVILPRCEQTHHQDGAH